MNVLITGANGFIGSNLMTLLSDVPNIKLFAGTRENIDLHSDSSIRDFKIAHQINAVIHCAISGRGLENETPDILHKNLLMYENLETVFPGHLFINLASGAEYDRAKNISTIFEGAIWDRVPSDYYGLSKNIIAKQVWRNPNGINLRLFGCFYHNELQTRFIKNSITNYLEKKPIVINQDRYMDFFYMEDLATVIKYYLITLDAKRPADLNMSYISSPKLSSIASCINSLGDHQVEIIIKDGQKGKNYCGYGKKLADLNLPLKGLETGIKECYERLKH